MDVDAIVESPTEENSFLSIDESKTYIVEESAEDSDLEETADNKIKGTSLAKPGGRSMKEEWIIPQGRKCKKSIWLLCKDQTISTRLRQYYEAGTGRVLREWSRLPLGTAATITPDLVGRVGRLDRLAAGGITTSKDSEEQKTQDKAILGDLTLVQNLSESQKTLNYKLYKNKILSNVYGNTHTKQR